MQIFLFARTSARLCKQKSLRRQQRKKWRPNKREIVSYEAWKSTKDLIRQLIDQLSGAAAISWRLMNCSHVHFALVLLPHFIPINWIWRCRNGCMTLLTFDSLCSSSERSATRSTPSGKIYIFINEHNSTSCPPSYSFSLENHRNFQITNIIIARFPSWSFIELFRFYCAGLGVCNCTCTHIIGSRSLPRLCVFNLIHFYRHRRPGEIYARVKINLSTASACVNFFWFNEITYTGS